MLKLDKDEKAILKVAFTVVAVVLLFMVSTAIKSANSAEAAGCKKPTTITSLIRTLGTKGFAEAPVVMTEKSFNSLEKYFRTTYMPREFNTTPKKVNFWETTTKHVLMTRATGADYWVVMRYNVKGCIDKAFALPVKLINSWRKELKDA